MGLRSALQGSSPGPAGAEAAPRVPPPTACLRLLLCLCRAFPGPGAGLWTPRGPSQGRRVRHGAEIGKGDWGWQVGIKMGCREGRLEREGGSRPEEEGRE